MKLSNEYFATLLDNISEAIIVTDKTHKIVYFNRAAVQVFGYHVEEILGRPLDLLLPERFVETYRQHMRKLTEPQTVLMIKDRPELVAKRKDGTEFPIEIGTSKIVQDGEEFYTAIIVDITERKRAADALRESDEKFHALIEHSSEAIVLVDAQGILLFSSPASERLFGYPRQERLGQSMFKRVHPDDLEYVRQAFVRFASEPGSIQTTECRLQRKDGNWRWVEVVGTNLLNLPAVHAIVINYRDITERKQAEDQIRFQASLLDQVTNGVAASDLDGKIIYWNQYAKVLHGWKAEEVLGKRVQDFLIPPSEIQRVSELMQSIISLSESEIELLLLKKDGSSFPAHVNYAVMKNHQGEPIGILGVSTDITERKRAEETLRKSEAQLSNAMKIANLGHWELDVASGMFTFTDNIYEIFRTNAKEMGGYQMSIADYAKRFVHPEEAFRIGEAIPKGTEVDVLNSDGGYLEHRMLYADGSAGHLAVRYFFVKDEKGRIIKTYGVNQDITERKRVEEVRRESEEKFHALIEHSSEAIVLVDAQGILLFASPANERIFGYSRQELLGQSMLMWVHPDDLEHARQSFVQIVSDLGSTQRVMCRHQHQEGTWRWIEAVFTNLLNLPAVHAIVINYRDITERKQAEDALRESEEKFRLIAERITEVFYLVDIRNNQTLYVSPGFEQVWGMSRSEVEKSPQNFMKAIHPDDLERVKEGLGVQQSGLPYDLEYRIIRPDGVMRWVWDQGYPVRNANGTINRYVGVAQDITEHKQAEEKIKRRAEEFAALYDTARDLAQQHDLSAQLETIVERAMKLIGASSGALHLYDARRDEVELQVSKGLPLPISTSLQMGEGLAGRVAQDRQPLILNDYQTGEHHLSKYESLDFRAMVAVPMLYGGELIGVLAVHEIGESTRIFTEQDMHLLSLFAEHAASAVHNKRLFEETHRRLQELEAINVVSRALRVAQTLDEMLPVLLERTIDVANAIMGSIWLYDTADNSLHQVVSNGIPPLTIHFKPGEGIFGTVFSSAQPYFAPDWREDRLTTISVRSQIPKGLSSAFIPIRTAQSTIGVLTVGFHSPHEFLEDQKHLLSTIAEIAGNAIHRTQLHEQTRRQLQRLSGLHQIDLAITGIPDLSNMLQILLDQVMTQLGVDAARVLVVDPIQQTLEFAASRGFTTDALHNTRLRFGEGYAIQAALDHGTIYIPDLNTLGTNYLHSPFLNAEGFVSYLAVPLVAKSGVQGVLEVFHRSPLKYDPEWLDFLEALASQAAIIIGYTTLVDDLQRSNFELNLAYDSTIEGWSQALDLRDRETKGHSQRVTDISLRLARAMAVREADLVHIRRGALLHDIGKLGIPDSILLKAGSLNEEERDIIRKHPTIAYEMLAPIAYLRPALDIPYGHHEKWNGTGYPRGLKGEEIPLSARIFAVVDVWDALTSDRPYRKAWSKEEAHAYIQEQAGEHFDPQVVDAFLSLMDDERSN